MSNAVISKSLGISESTARNYRKRPIDKIYEMASNKITREMHGELIAIKINQKLKKIMLLIKMENY